MQLHLNKENFHQTLNRFSTSELETLIEKFPYFQQAHLLLAKKYQQEKHPRFDEQLQMAALYTPDRELLFSIFNEVAKISPIKSVKKREEIHPQEVVIEVEAKLEVPVRITEEIKVEVIEQEPTKLLDEDEIVSAAEESVAQLTEETEIEIQEQTIEETEKEVVAQVKTKEKIIAEKEEIFNANEPHTFDEWLQVFAQPDTSKLLFARDPLPAEPEKLDEELNKMILQSAAVNLHDLVEESTNYSKGLSEFIGEQIQKHKPVKTKTSSNENEMPAEIATETLAKLYEAQKKYQKATHVYEALQLKYPEKNDFFAARINELKNLL